MPVNYQIAIDCTNPDLLARFWAEALGYVPAPAPEGYDTWDDYWRHMGVPEQELGIGVDIIADPDGRGPHMQFHIVPETKTIKNRIHFDIHASGGRAVPIDQRKQRVDAEADRLALIGATRIRTMESSDLDHYAVAMRDPEGNEFDIN